MDLEQAHLQCMRSDPQQMRMHDACVRKDIYIADATRYMENTLQPKYRMLRKMLRVVVAVAVTTHLRVHACAHFIFLQRSPSNEPLDKIWHNAMEFHPGNKPRKRVYHGKLS